MIGLSAPLEGLSRAQASFDSAAAKIAQPVSLDSPNLQDQVSLSDQMVALAWWLLTRQEQEPFAERDSI